MATSTAVAEALRLAPDADRYLDHRTQRILELRAAGYTLGETGRLADRRWTLSGQRIRQIEEEAIEHLRRHRLRDTPEGFYVYERFGSR